MKFEKINKDKIKVTLNTDDLLENDIDMHSFMSNSEESQSLFLNVLNRAEEDLGFSTDNYSIRVETIALSDGCFILTITRISENSNNTKEYNPPLRKKIKASRKSPKEDLTSLVYKFENFDDFCTFANSIKTVKELPTSKLCKDLILYSYKNNYYLIFENLNIKFLGFKLLFSAITEFATYIENPEIFIANLYEKGTIVFKHKALQKCIKYFS